MNLRPLIYVAACLGLIGASPLAHAESATDVSPICTSVFNEDGPRTLLGRGAFCYRTSVMEYRSSSVDRTSTTDADVEAYVYSDNPSNDLSWNVTFRFRTKHVGGEWVPLQLKPYIDCAEKCTVTEAPAIDLVPGALTSESAVTLTPTMSGENPMTFTPVVEYRIVRAGESFDDGQSMAHYRGTGFGFIPTIRCDDGLARRGTKGCVYPEAPAIFRGVSLSDPGVRESAIHIREAQAAGLRGKYEPAGDGSILASSRIDPLTRTRDRTLIYDTRAAARKKYVEQYAEEPICELTDDPDEPPGPCNCDEYPFASTGEGASKGTVSVKRISSADNQLAGTRLGNFYTSGRVLHGDAFYVDILD